MREQRPSVCFRKCLSITQVSKFMLLAYVYLSISIQTGLPAGWEKSETVNDIPYYLKLVRMHAVGSAVVDWVYWSCIHPFSHNDEVTQWDHPALSALFKNFGKVFVINHFWVVHCAASFLELLNKVHYGAYRIAKKIRLLQVLSNSRFTQCVSFVLFLLSCFILL